MGYYPPHLTPPGGGEGVADALDPPSRSAAESSGVFFLPLDLFFTY